MHTVTVRWRSFWPTYLLAGLLAIGVMACGADQGTGNNAGGGNTGFSTEIYPNQVQIAADPKGALKWDRTTYEAKAGAITFVVTNTSPIAHNFAIIGNGVQATSKNFRSKDPEFLSLPNLAPGEYQIVCTVPGHREGGMVAKLVVT